MSDLFGYYLKTGSGTTFVMLLLTGTEAIVEVDSAWMGYKAQYRLHFDHEAVTDVYGFLSLREVYHYDRAKNYGADLQDIDYLVAPFANLEDEEDETVYVGEQHPVPYRDFTYAYLRLATPQPWIADEPSLEEMKHFFSGAQWPDYFNLFLWRHFGPTLDTIDIHSDDIATILYSLDKIRLTSALDKEFSRYQSYEQELHKRELDKEAREWYMYDTEADIGRTKPVDSDNNDEWREWFLE